ncbi:alpha/beta fold hydrolase [Microbacterium allomyrinae]|uniref:Alpha/beta fold hydrolase n=1 Tax=Microbacterium allomyrinae TaxID=2830666 RepID=A0A9X1S3V7_9MICO|nr:alpha/beta fold hydrolase [Microbacterium allomyrinae]MCC2032383.1 alpha/beta fold hydrolase [Microbacterium allomyrinae]
MSLDLPLRPIRAGELSVAYYDTGARSGEPVVLLHGFPNDVHSYVDVIPLLVDAGFRVIVPSLRGHAQTRFLNPDAVRSGQQSAPGADLMALIDALRLEQPVLAGYDWGARAACVVADPARRTPPSCRSAARVRGRDHRRCRASGRWRGTP